MPLNYVIVEFEKEAGSGETSLEVVPETWRDTEGNGCFLYPEHYTAPRVIKAAKKGEPPTDLWKSFPVKKEWLTTESWDRANRRCTKLVATSNPSDSEEDLSIRKRKRKKNSKYIDEDDDDDCEMIMDNSRDTISESEEEQVNLPTPPRLLVARLNKVLVTNDRTSNDRTSNAEHPSISTPRTTKSTGAARNSTSEESSPLTAAMTRMFAALEAIKQKQDKQEQMLSQALQLLAEASLGGLRTAADEEEAGLPNLPSSSFEELVRLNEIVQDPAAKKKLVRSLSLVGGKNLQAVIRNVCRKIIDNELAKKMNLTGSKGKQGLSVHSSLLAVMTNGIRGNKGYRDASEKEIYASMGTWFTGSRDRNGERNARRNIPAPAPVPYPVPMPDPVQTPDEE
ncbi:uncharacterized protein LOC105439294 [Strongylocentrotus purpuratus]|uniref:DUF4806 domain-containing protein n=1 Tax=Strongylocentrotus purpuratus TaxID=7668 RepID=A0A7M7T088_STRPU|nr:uncharacterized protein LOC105439294 [Strongylocentrotus purpuratus]|eukprot:XP_011666424.1 PREDICTED: uncharacterized protein LOC105439294 [Strongylocentrotus purpuratus]